MSLVRKNTSRYLNREILTQAHARWYVFLEFEDRDETMNQSVAVLVWLVSMPALAGAETIAVIGTGDVGRALGTRFAQAGHSVNFGSRTPEADRVRAMVSEAGENVAALTPPEAAAAADMIVLAVPFGSAVDVLRSLGDTAGKVVIDVSNPLIRSEGRYVRATDTSVAAQLQAAAPEAHVVKALNALAYRTMADPELAGGTVTIPMAGNDAEAKARVASLIADLGFDSWDLGPVEYAEVLEDMPDGAALCEATGPGVQLLFQACAA